MPKFMSGVNLFKQEETAPNTVYIATTNAEISGSRLIMGGGAARDMREGFPGSDLMAAEVIKRVKDPMKYGYLRFTKNCGIFQTKDLIRRPSNLELIKLAVAMLADDANAHSDWEFRLPFPGIGLGSLSRAEVLPLLKPLPNNVVVYEI